jgi:predicted nucleic acid-binding protein
MTLVDTSIWIEMFRRRDPLDLEAEVDFDELVTCLPVIQEVLQGFRDEAAYRRAEEAMLSLPRVESPMTEQVYRAAVDLYRTGRRTGHTIRSSVDCLIAACALANDLEVLHQDRDYAAIARFSRLRQREIGGP